MRFPLYVSFILAFLMMVGNVFSIQKQGNLFNKRIVSSSEAGHAYSKKRGKSDRPKNPELIKDYLAGTGIFHSTGEHFLLNAFMGIIMGGIYGGMIGFYNYESDKTGDQFESVILTAGIVGGVGLVTGGLVSVIEYFRDEQFTIGPPLMNYTFYSTLLGGILGSLAGLVPFSSDNDIDSIINFASFGAAGGLALGTVLYIIGRSFGSEDEFNFDLGYSPKDENYFLKISRPISF